ncbi:RDD family protein [Diaminobutyricimonas sp. TR449]|uniref:RDD family protein n=1 Tax=Diaminobutyricimonas sp. TR449 TaxID=2708076 RepID=UPI0014232487|nr:RDD family protein [Diaminobutyricimonas sp. TR449]
MSGSATLYHDAADDELLIGEAVSLDLRPTSFILRGAGTAIDFVAYLVVYIGYLLLLVWISTELNLDQAALSAVLIAGFVLCLVALPTAVELLTHGRSLGKLAIGARIVRDDGGAIGFRHAFIRALTGVLEIFLTVGGMAALIGLLSPKAKRLGDLMAGTYSQHERMSRLTPPVHGVPAQLQQWAVTADVARMPDPLARRIAAFLAEAPRFTPATRDRLSHELAAEASAFVSPVPQIDAELFLAGVAAVRRDREYQALTLERQHLERLAPTLGGLPHRFPNR